MGIVLAVSALPIEVRWRLSGQQEVEIIEYRLQTKVHGKFEVGIPLPQAPIWSMLNGSRYFLLNCNV
jgi:hypothetical protein